MIYICRQGRNAFEPSIAWLNWRYNVKRFGWKVRFLPSCRFIIDGHDQKDWSKVGGLSRHLYKNDVNSTMAGFTYDPEVDKIALNCYSHISGDTVRSATQLYVEIDKYVDIWFESNYALDMVRTYFLYEGGLKFYDTTYGKLGRFTREIGAWFGGADSNKDGLGDRAPQDMEIEKIAIWRYRENQQGILVPDNS